MSFKASPVQIHPIGNPFAGKMDPYRLVYGAVKPTIFLSVLGSCYKNRLWNRILSLAADPSVMAIVWDIMIRECRSPKVLTEKRAAEGRKVWQGKFLCGPPLCFHPLIEFIGVWLLHNATLEEVADA